MREGGTTFTPTWNDKGYSNEESLDVGDYDLDGDMDFMLGQDNGNLRLWKNVSSAGPYAYVVDQVNYAVAKIDLALMAKVDTIDFKPVAPGSVPSGIAVWGPYLYICDGIRQVVRVNKYNYADKMQAGTWGTGLNQFKGPQGIACDDNYLYIADSGNKRVVRYNRHTLIQDNEVTQVAPGDDFSNPTGVAADNQFVYVTDFAKNRVVRLRKGLTMTVDGFTAAIPAGSGNLELNGPFGIAADQNPPNIGNLYIADRGNNRIIVRKKKDFAYVAQKGTLGTGDDQFKNPTGITFTNDGNIVVADQGNDRLQVRQGASTMNLIAKDDIGMQWTPGFVGYDWGGSTVPTRAYVGPVWTSPTSRYYEDIVWADLDGDGDLDFAAAADDSNPNHIVMRNEGLDAGGNPIFNEVWTANGEDTEGVDAGDVDRDGRQDLVFLSDFQSTGPRVKYFQNNGNATFTYRWGSDEDTGYYKTFHGDQVTLLDLNGDDLLDIAATATETGSPTTTYTGMVVFKNQLAGYKKIRITSTSSKGRYKSRITNTYRVKDDGTLGEVIATEVK